MNPAKLFLGFGVLVWLPYGLYCVFVPSALDEFANLVGTSPTGLTEIRAMYGGLQAGIGALCAFAILRDEHRHSVLLALVFLTGGLALARAIGLGFDGGGSAYTYGAICFETLNTVVAWVLARREEGSA